MGVDILLEYSNIFWSLELNRKLIRQELISSTYCQMKCHFLQTLKSHDCPIVNCSVFTLLVIIAGGGGEVIPNHVTIVIQDSS